MAATHDYYAILGVPSDADAKQIKRAFRQKAMEHHPDRNRGSAASTTRFRAVNEAHQTLADPVLRARYDRMLHGRPLVEYGPAGPGARWEGPRNVARSLEVRAIDLERSGGHLRFRVPVECSCVLCDGDGTVGTERTCRDCEGGGYRDVSTHEARAGRAAETACSACDGRDTRPPRPCPVCRGRGLQAQEHAVTVDVGVLAAGRYTVAVRPDGADEPVVVELRVVATRTQTPGEDGPPGRGRP